MKRSSILTLTCALMAQHAYAQDAGVPSCDTVTVGTPIYIGGSTALQPFVKTVGPVLAAQTGAEYTLFYYGGGSCAGVNNLVPATSGGSLNLITSSTNLDYYVTEGGAVVNKKCTMPASQNGQLDVAISDVFLQSCLNYTPPAGFADFTGPAQGMVFAVPNGSSQTAITAEEAYVALGFGGSGQVAAPWTADPTTHFFIRADSSGTKRVLAATIGVPYAKWKGKQESGSGGVYTDLTAATDAESSLGIIGLDYLDQNDSDGTPRRNKVKELAFAAYGQKYAFYPDSTHTSYDKKNLREGRYAGLGYAHFIAPVDNAGVPTSAKVKYVIDLLTGASVTPAPAFDVTKVIAKDAHLVPLCAMKVKRTAEGGDITAFQPVSNCSCYFESLVGTASADCQTCTTSCASGFTCRNGYCESN